MGLFSVTSLSGNTLNIRDFKTSNINITIDNVNLKISKLQITEDQWSNNI